MFNLLRTILRHQLGKVKVITLEFVFDKTVKLLVSMAGTLIG